MNVWTIKVSFKYKRLMHHSCLKIRVLFPVCFLAGMMLWCCSVCQGASTVLHWQKK